LRQSDLFVAKIARRQYELKTNLLSYVGL
jgi:hypothetical protein